MNLPKDAYEAYSRRAGGKSLATGQPLPDWETLPEAIQNAWKAATDAVQLKLRESKASKLKTQDGKVTAKTLEAMMISQGYRCALTGRELEPSTTQLDHIHPVSKGGEHDLSNLQLVHCDANRAKGRLTQHEFVTLCHEVAAKFPIA